MGDDSRQRVGRAKNVPSMKSNRREGEKQKKKSRPAARSLGEVCCPIRSVAVSESSEEKLWPAMCIGYCRW